MILGSRWRKTFVLIIAIAVLYHFRVFDEFVNVGKDSEAQKHLSETDRELLTQFYARDVSEPPNPEFVFHNKMPKSGSSTMNAILHVLSEWNKFRFVKYEPKEDVYGHFYEGGKVARAIAKVQQEYIDEPIFIFKHHYMFNATKFGLDEPTWINVIRDPITWFESNFYFKRFGWERNPGTRSREEDQLTVDKCVRTGSEPNEPFQGHEDCKRVKWKYLQFLCGNNHLCLKHSEGDKKKAAEIAKANIVNRFYVIGILEQFIDTLNLFDKILPRYYRRAVEALNSDQAQQVINATKTQRKIPMNEKSRAYFRNGPLKYECDVYAFARMIFNEYLDRTGTTRFIKPT